MKLLCEQKGTFCVQEVNEYLHLFLGKNKQKLIYIESVCRKKKYDWMPIISLDLPDVAFHQYFWKLMRIDIQLISQQLVFNIYWIFISVFQKANKKDILG